MSKGRSLSASRVAGFGAGASVERHEQGGLGVLVSVLLHAGIIFGALITFQQTRLELADQSPPVVPVDLVTIAQKSNIAPEVRVAPKLKEDTIQPQKFDLPQFKPAPVETEPAPSEEAELRPLRAKPEPARKPKPQRMVEQPQKKESEQDFSALLNKLTAPTSAPRNAKVASRDIKGFGAESAMTLDLSDALSNQISRCWNPQIGAPRSDEMIVDFDLFLNPDGSVAQPPQLTASSRLAAASDPYTRAAADAARRAIYQCQPYRLPADRYSLWHEINPFHFDPSRMMGQ
jgi:hypothetical protein